MKRALKAVRPGRPHHSFIVWLRIAASAEGRIPTVSIITCCITGVSEEYSNRANRQRRQMVNVAKGGGGGLSDQLVTIPRFKDSALH